ncbi:hypothetical protein [Acidiphilium angustum]|nr:hypothetical protein [Acidiphilium angustum]
MMPDDVSARFAEHFAATLTGLTGVAIETAPHVTGGSEDATFFMRRVQERGGQAIYAVVGSDIPSGHHTPEFDINEADFPWVIEALATGIMGLGRKSPD